MKTKSPINLSIGYEKYRQKQSEATYDVGLVLAKAKLSILAALAQFEQGSLPAGTLKELQNSIGVGLQKIAEASMYAEAKKIYEDMMI